MRFTKHSPVYYVIFPSQQSCDERIITTILQSRKLRLGERMHCAHSPSGPGWSPGRLAPLPGTPRSHTSLRTTQTSVNLLALCHFLSPTRLALRKPSLELIGAGVERGPPIGWPVANQICLLVCPSLLGRPQELGNRGLTTAGTLGRCASCDLFLRSPLLPSPACPPHPYSPWNL